jgi:transcriptional regulator with XRE-family HTH domain
MSGMGDRLTFALEQRGVRKLYALAVEIGVDESALSRWKKDGPISLPSAARLSQALDISLDWLILGRGHIDAHRPSPAHPFERLSSDEADRLQFILEELTRLAKRQASA